jgi:general secretion pathway protein J
MKIEHPPQPDGPMKIFDSQSKIENLKSKIESGFTLVEVAIAITLLAMMVLMLYGSFHLGERAATKAAARAEESQRLRTRQEFLAGYIRSAYPYHSTPRDPSVYFSGAEGGLEFISSLSNGLGGRGMSKVRVAWESAGTLTLEEEMPARVSPPGNLSSQASEGGYRNRLVLAEEAGQLRMEYLDSQSEVESWVGEWDGRLRKALPRAVRMTYRDERGDEVRWTFPIMMSVLTP